MKSLFSLYALLFAVANLSAQTCSVDLTITDSKNNPLAKTEIELLLENQSLKKLKTNKQGTCTLKDLKQETSYELRISKEGYNTLSTPLTTGKSEKMQKTLSLFTLKEEEVRRVEEEKIRAELEREIAIRMQKEAENQMKSAEESRREASRKKTKPKPKPHPNYSFNAPPAPPSRDLSKDKNINGPIKGPKPEGPIENSEEYGKFQENEYIVVKDEALSTFSIDVDRASYSNSRRFLDQGKLPPKDAVRVEEMINYFDYDYPQPKNKHPFSVNTELSDCPWNKDAKLMQIGLQGKKMDLSKAPNSNLVFLLDVSGSMNRENKLPLLKESLKLLVNNLRDEDKVSIVVYAGAAGLVLPATRATDKAKIIEAMEGLRAGGSTAGGAGIQLAYKVAKENFIKGGNNRVILATDGDFNVGVSGEGALENLITKKREDGIFLTVLGFGMGNYKDNKMEILADKGNGNYAYIDNLKEAQKTLVGEIGGTLFTIAKDVKLQIEFNPAFVHSYRLVGYENRLLNKEDFNDDTKDAGEMGAGHTVTAFYELVLADGKKKTKDGKKVDDLKYQTTTTNQDAASSGELATIKLRYKKPDGDKSILMEEPLKNEFTDLASASENFRYAASVAGLGMLLRDSKFKNELDYDKVIELAEKAKGKDKNGYRAEFIQLAKKAKVISSKEKADK